MNVLVYEIAGVTEEVVLYASERDAQAAADAWAVDHGYRDYYDWDVGHSAEDVAALRWLVVKVHLDDETERVCRWFRDSLSAERPADVTVPASFQRAMLHAWQGDDDG